MWHLLQCGHRIIYFWCDFPSGPDPTLLYTYRICEYFVPADNVPVRPLTALMTVMSVIIMMSRCPRVHEGFDDIHVFCVHYDIEKFISMMSTMFCLHRRSQNCIFLKKMVTWHQHWAKVIRFSWPGFGKGPPSFLNFFSVPIKYWSRKFVVATYGTYSEKLCKTGYL
jgi:hypothetical protein